MRLWLMQERYGNCCQHADRRLALISPVADLKRLYFTAGVENKPTVFLFNDVQVVEEAFLEDINNILSSGEVPNLYKPDEFEEVWTRLYGWNIDWIFVVELGQFVTIW